MKINKKKLVKALSVPILVGAAAGILSSSTMKNFKQLHQPPLSPPGWLFPVAWTTLYLLMGTSNYLIKTSDAEAEEISENLLLYRYQLIVNFLWPIFFFDFQWHLFSLIWLVLLWVLVLIMTKRFYGLSEAAAYLNIPYLLWLTFAAYLSLGVWWLNM